MQVGSPDMLPQLVHDVSTVCSIVSLVISSVVAWKLSKVTARYRDVAQVPFWIKTISAHKRNLRTSISKKNMAEIKRVASVLVILSEDVIANCSRKHKSQIIVAHKDLKRTAAASVDAIGLDDATSVQIAIDTLETYLELHGESQKWI